MNLARLYLRSRITGSATLWLLGLGGTAWLLAKGTDNACLTLLIRLITPFAASVVIGFSARSPFGETEDASGNTLLRLRFGQLAGLVVLAMGLFALAGTADAGTDAVAIMIRNLLGFTGLMLAGAVLTGIARAWIVPFTWGAIAFLAAMPDSAAGWWAWPVRSADHTGAFVAAVMLAIAGLYLASRKGTNDRYVVAGGIVE